MLRKKKSKKSLAVTPIPSNDEVLKWILNSLKEG
tara:strand:+ start:797 stop:898 length:102 start_codon:yes stop_codon:yes gene_type:complete